MDNNIQVFLKVVEEGSFRKAAEKLGYTQAGISYAIQALESQLGVSLFIREKKGVQLSTEAKQLLPYMKQIEADNKKLFQAIHDLKGLEQGSLRIQIFDSISIHWIPNILQQFKKDYPGISIELISEEDSLTAEEMVYTGEVDCGFFLTDVTANIDTIKLKEEFLLAIVSPDHELANAKCFPIEKLGVYPYISMKFDSHTGMKHIFDKYNAVPNTAYLMDNDYAAMAMVSKGFGYCIFPELLLKNVPYEIKCLGFDIPQTRTIRIGTRSLKTASSACLKFIEYTRKWVSENA